MGRIDDIDDINGSEDSDNEEEGLSPLAPGRLSCRWSSPAQLVGFDKQTPPKATADTPGTAGTESLSPQDLWNDDEDDSYVPIYPSHRSRGVRGGRGGRALVWDYLPGETSITLGVRLYLTHLDPFMTHEENCALLLRQASAYPTILYHTTP